MEQDKIVNNMDVMLRNARLPEVWEILKTSKRASALVNNGEEILDSFRSIRAGKFHAKAESKKGTAQKRSVMIIANVIFRVFSDDLRRIFSDDPQRLEMLELTPQPFMRPDGPESDRIRRPRSQSEAAKLEKWRRMMINIRGFGDEVLAILTKEGYPKAVLREQVLVLNLAQGMRSRQREAVGLRKKVVKLEETKMRVVNDWMAQFMSCLDICLAMQPVPTALYVRQALNVAPDRRGALSGMQPLDLSGLADDLEDPYSLEPEDLPEDGGAGSGAGSGAGAAGSNSNDLPAEDMKDAEEELLF